MSKNFSSRQFWQDQESWPVDGQGYVFLGRAVNVIGKCMFADSWSDDDPFRDDDTQSSQRFDEVQKVLVESLREGNLRSVLRPQEGGAFSRPLKSYHWNIDHWGERFSFCVMDRPDQGVTLDAPQFVYIEKHGIDQICKREKDCKPTLLPGDIPEDLFLSDYMKLAIEAVNFHAISEEEFGNKHAIQAWIQEKAKEKNVEISGTLAGHIATIIRPTEAMKGRGAKKK